MAITSVSASTVFTSADGLTKALPHAITAANSFAVMTYSGGSAENRDRRAVLSAKVSNAGVELARSEASFAGDLNVAYQIISDDVNISVEHIEVISPSAMVTNVVLGSAIVKDRSFVIVSHVLRGSSRVRGRDTEAYCTIADDGLSVNLRFAIAPPTGVHYQIQVVQLADGFGTVTHHTTNFSASNNITIPDAVLGRAFVMQSGAGAYNLGLTSGEGDRNNARMKHDYYLGENSTNTFYDKIVIDTDSTMAIDTHFQVVRINSGVSVQLVPVTVPAAAQAPVAAPTITGTVAGFIAGDPVNQLLKTDTLESNRTDVFTRIAIAATTLDVSRDDTTGTLSGTIQLVDWGSDSNLPGLTATIFNVDTLRPGATTAFDYVNYTNPPDTASISDGTTTLALTVAGKTLTTPALPSADTTWPFFGTVTLTVSDSVSSDTDDNVSVFAPPTGSSFFSVASATNGPLSMFKDWAVVPDDNSQVVYETAKLIPDANGAGGWGSDFVGDQTLYVVDSFDKLIKDWVLTSMIAALPVWNPQPSVGAVDVGSSGVLDVAALVTNENSIVVDQVLTGGFAFDGTNFTWDGTQPIASYGPFSFTATNDDGSAQSDPFNVVVQAELPGLPNLVVPALPPATGNIVNVANITELNTAMDNLVAEQTILLADGDYDISAKALAVSARDVTIRGASGDQSAVVLRGLGMNIENLVSSYGFYATGEGLTVANLTIRDTWSSSVQLQTGAHRPHLYNVRMIDAGEQFVKSVSGNAWNAGNSAGIVEYCTMEYTAGPPTRPNQEGYTNGVDVHGGTNWIVRRNIFKDFHTPDSTQYPWNPAILMWNGSVGTIAEDNLIINCDRAIAFGLDLRTQGFDHSGGIIRNNVCVLDSGLFTSARTTQSDAQIIGYHAIGAKIYQNTVITNGNTNHSIEMRWDNTGSDIASNLTDNSLNYRTGAADVGGSGKNNILDVDQAIFTDPAGYDFSLSSEQPLVVRLEDVPLKYVDVRTSSDALQRNPQTNVGADQFAAFIPPANNPPSVTAPADISLTFPNGDAGLSQANGALLTWLAGAAVADDTDTPPPTATNNASALGDPIPAGAHTITWSATDSLGLTGTDTAVLTVSEAQTVNMTVVGVVDLLGQPVTRIYNEWYLTDSDINISNSTGVPVNVVARGSNLSVINGNATVTTTGPDAGGSYTLVAWIPSNNRNASQHYFRDVSVTITAGS